MSEAETKLYEDVMKALPMEWKDSLRDEIHQMNRSRNKKIVVLDDDPTGVQTVHDIFVLTQWNKPLLREAFRSTDSVFFILTNTRSFDADKAAEINREIAENVHAVAEEEGMDFAFVSRSDSTLRGYYPLEIDVLSDGMRFHAGLQYDGHFIIPAFFEGGRYTCDNVHYLKDGGRLIPVQQTEFAKDKIFGFSSGNLCDWVEEKTGARFKAENCITVSIEQLRQGPDAVEPVLLNIGGNVPVIVNAMSYADLDVLSLAVLRAEAKGKRFIFRTAASFVKSYSGIFDKDYLSGELLIAAGNEKHGGIVIVGSHVQKTTRQLENLIKGTKIVPLEMDVKKILDTARQENEVKRLINEVNRAIGSGKDVVVFSSRNLISAKNKTDNLMISQTVSNSLSGIVRSLEVPPKFIIAKGGITSSDTATKGLNIKKAKVLGQAAPGVPVWLTGEEAKFPNIPYIVFPGNVGDDTTLMEIVQKISNS